MIAKLADSGEYLPHTPPMTGLLGVKWETQKWYFDINYHYFAEQDNVAINETTTDGFGLLNTVLERDIALGDTEMTLQLKGQNLLDEYGLNHVSYLKEQAPVVGRNISLGLRWNF